MARGGKGMNKKGQDHSAKEKKGKTEDFPAAKISHRKKISLVWTAPLIAILLAGFLVYKSLPGEGQKITIRAKDGSGIEANSTLITYRGVRVGIVNKVLLEEELAEVVINAKLEKYIESIAREKTVFWIVRPKISSTEIKGLKTIVTGPYITLRPGGGEPKFEFAALPAAPREEKPEKGLNIKLKTTRIGGVKSGTPILYRDLVIGKVYDYQLSENSSFVVIFANIKEAYKNLVRQNSVFWNSGGFDLKVSLLGAKINSQSIQGLLSGGISLATPDKPGDHVSDDTIFQLHEEEEDEWLEWTPKIEIQSEKGEMKSRKESSTKEGIGFEGMLK